MNKDMWFPLSPLVTTPTGIVLRGRERELIPKASCHRGGHDLAWKLQRMDSYRFPNKWSSSRHTDAAALLLS